MMKSEFEEMALRGSESIGQMMYESIERFYTSDNEYHQAHGGINETKQEFVKRVFGGKVNTPKTIAEKIAREAIKENRWALRGNPTATKTRLDEHDTLITEHYMYMLKRRM
jgi:hypothetical protein